MGRGNYPDVVLSFPRITSSILGNYTKRHTHNLFFSSDEKDETDDSFFPRTTQTICFIPRITSSILEHYTKTRGIPRPCARGRHIHIYIYMYTSLSLSIYIYIYTTCIIMISNSNNSSSSSSSGDSSTQRGDIRYWI